MYSSFSYRKRINSLVDDSNWDLLAISKVLYDSKATDKEMLDIIRVYVEQRIDENLKKKER